MKKASPAGSTSNDADEVRLVLRPTMAKTFLKGVIAVAVFSVFLQLSVANLLHYLIFLGITLGLLLAFVVFRQRSRFEIGEESLVIKRPLRKETSIAYQDILDISVAQGIMARRFKCGTVFLLLKGGKGGIRVMGGGAAEQLEEIPRPDKICELITSRLSPFAHVVEP